MFSVAIPTCKRPKLLARALQSLIAQTTTVWVAVVFDDSPQGEGEEIVSHLKDSRITYQRNVAPMGAAMNIDACFAERFARRQGLACLLEDDNTFEPGYLDHVATIMDSTRADVGLFNQRIRERDVLLPESETTRGEWFSDGWILPEQLHSSLLLMEGLSNGGIVWRPESQIRLKVGETVKLTALHEACRSLLITKPIFYSSRALAVWTRLPTALTARKNEPNRIINRGNQSITDFVIGRYGRKAVDRATDYAIYTGRIPQLILRLLHAGYITAALRVDRAMALRHLGLVLKGWALRRSYSDPCEHFLNDLRSRDNELNLCA